MRKMLVVLSMVLAVSLHASPAPGSDMPPPRFEFPDRAAKLATAFPEIAKRFRAWAEERHAPGAIMGIVVDGELAWLETAGVADVATSEPVERDTLFRIASMTKSFTAVAILQLRDEGKLRLDDPVALHLPELAGLELPTEDSPAITIRHLLTHSEGFPEDNPWGDRQLAQTDAVMDAWMKEGIPFSNAPGVGFEYSNYGFAILGRIVSEVSGMPYDEYVRERVLLPLGMERSTFHPPHTKFARGYRWEEERWKAEPILAHGSFGAMGGLWTNAPELARYVEFLLSAFPAHDGEEREPLQRSSAREMQQGWRSSGSSALRAPDGRLQLRDAAYGYGLGVTSDCRFAHLVGHGGGLPGYGSYMVWLPEHGVGLIGMSNLTYLSPAPVMMEALDLLRATGGLERRRPQPSQVLLDAKGRISGLVAEWDDALASEAFADNVFLDRAEDVRKKELDELRARHGSCISEDRIAALNALRGSWRMNCERGWIDVTITLAPTSPPLVQKLDVSSVLPPSAGMTRLLGEVLSLATHWQERRASRLAARTLEARQLRMTIDRLREWGPCRAGDAVAGDGTSLTTVNLECDRGRARLRVTRDPASGKLQKLEVAPHPEERCSP